MPTGRSFSAGLGREINGWTENPFLYREIRGILAWNWARDRSQILLDPGGLHVLAPVADVPLTPGAEATQFIRPAIDGHVND